MSSRMNWAKNKANQIIRAQYVRDAQTTTTDLLIKDYLKGKEITKVGEGVKGRLRTRANHKEQSRS